MVARKRSADPIEDVQDDEPEAVLQDEGPAPQAAPDPPSTPGIPVPAAASPARTAPLPISEPLAPVQSWLVPTA
jgi:hypothetical protein